MASGFGAGWSSWTSIQWPIASGCAASPPPTLRHTVDRRTPVDDDDVEQAVEVEVDDGRASRALEARRCQPTRPPRRTSRPPDRSAGCWGRRSPARPVRRRSPSSRTGRRWPSLFTSANSGCHAVEGSTSSPVYGRCAVTPTSSAMSRYSGRSPPESSVWSLLSPWLVRNTSGRPSPVTSWLAMPMPQICSGRHPSASVYSVGGSPGHDAPQLLLACRGSSAGRSRREGRGARSDSSR